MSVYSKIETENRTKAEITGKIILKSSITENEVTLNESKRSSMIKND